MARSKVADLESAVRASMARGRKEVSEQMASTAVDAGREQALLEAIQAQPAEVANYLELARVVRGAGTAAATRSRFSRRRWP